MSQTYPQTGFWLIFYFLWLKINTPFYKFMLIL